MEKKQTLNYKIDCIANHIQTQKSDYFQVAFSEWASIMQDHAQFSVDQELDLVVEQIKAGKVDLETGTLDITAIKKSTRMQQFVGFLVSNHQNVADNIQYEFGQYDPKILSDNKDTAQTVKSNQNLDQFQIETKKLQDSTKPVEQQEQTPAAESLLKVPQSQGFEKYSKIYQWQIRFSPEEAEFVRMEKPEQIQYLVRKWNDLDPTEHQQFEEIDISELFQDRNPYNSKVNQFDPDEKNEDQNMDQEDEKYHNEDNFSKNNVQTNKVVKLKEVKKRRPRKSKVQKQISDPIEKPQNQEITEKSDGISSIPVSKGITENQQMSDFKDNLNEKTQLNREDEGQTMEKRKSLSESASLESSGDDGNKDQNLGSQINFTEESQIPIQGENKTLIDHLSQIGKKQ